MNGPQITTNALIYAAEIGIIALGISLSYALLRFANFAHLELVVFGAYLSYGGTNGLQLPLWLATLLSCIATGLLAISIDLSVFRRLRGASAGSKMIASWGVALVLRSFLAAVFGGTPRAFDISFTPHHYAGALFTSLDVVVVATVTGAMVLLHQALGRTKIGTALRATASDVGLAEARGIPSEAMIRLMWFIAGCYAALGGTLLAIETQLQPTMDLEIIIPVFAAATLGGLGNVFGAVGGAVLLSAAQSVILGIDFGRIVSTTSWFVATRYKDLIALFALIATLLVKPRGLTGRAAPQSR
jgi:branched-subunit amino acid ABC-type transport system permease component